MIRPHPTPLQVRQLLNSHLRAWLGAWPPAEEFQIVGAQQRAKPGWDGEVHSFIGIESPIGTVLSIAPDMVSMLRATQAKATGVDDILTTAATLHGGYLLQGVFRWSDSAASLPDAGIWLPADDPRVPAWLRPFGGEALVALDDVGRYMAGVGIKRHDDFGHELAVVTEPEFQGRGLAKRLVAQAARRVLEMGKVPTYLHDPENFASAHTAEAAGFPDRGWHILGITDRRLD